MGPPGNPPAKASSQFSLWPPLPQLRTSCAPHLVSGSLFHPRTPRWRFLVLPVSHCSAAPSSWDYRGRQSPAACFRTRFLSTAPRKSQKGSPRRVTHPSTNRAQCCLTSLFLWEEVNQRGCRPLTNSGLMCEYL